MKTPLLLIPLFALLACSQTQTENLKGFAASPAGQNLLNHVETIALAAADSALQQYESTGTVAGEQVARDSLSSVSHQLRGLQTTDAAATAGAIKQAVKKGSATPVVTNKVAPAVAQAVSDAARKGIPADVANEAAARGLDKAAAKHKPSKRTRAAAKSSA